ncbi:MAG TPA: polysaccharide deacetylase family protein [Hanamia sp.]
MFLIYLPKISTRCVYVFDLIFKQELGFEYSVTTDITAFKEYKEEKLNYSGAKTENEIFIKASSLLFETEIKKQEIKIEEKDHTKFLFPNKDCDLGFDIFSAIFYMVSRYEEYLPFTPDEFGRYKAEDSLAFQNDFLHIPIVNTWINIFKNELLKKLPDLKMRSPAFNAIVTYDIDVAYKYRGRNLVRTLGSALKDLAAFKINDIITRNKTLLKIKKDPWDVYDALKEIILQNKLQSVFFFLLADKTEHDRNLNYKNPLMKKLINEIETFSEIGIHPSFNSSTFPEKILIEKERLENLSGKKITKSRQHYLKFVLPDTYNSLLSSGITEDYSMGFPGKPGFRAGTSKPFYFYDLKNEKATNLKIFPVTCMDATFIYYTKKSPEKSLMEILHLLKEIKKVEGTFICIFHNEHLGEGDESKKWKSVHDKMIMQIKSYLKK